MLTVSTKKGLAHPPRSSNLDGKGLFHLLRMRLRFGGDHASSSTVVYTAIATKIHTLLVFFFCSVVLSQLGEVCIDLPGHRPYTPASYPFSVFNICVNIGWGGGGGTPVKVSHMFCIRYSHRPGYAPPDFIPYFLELGKIYITTTTSQKKNIMLLLN